MGLWHTNGSPNLGQETRRNNNQQRKITSKIVVFPVPADHRIPCYGIEKKLWSMQVTIIPIVIGAFGTVTKGLLKGLEGLEIGRREETIQTTLGTVAKWLVKGLEDLEIN